MKWKFIGCAVVLAGLAAGCSSSGSSSPSWASGHGGSRPVSGLERYAHQDNWDKIRTGMTERQVASRIGNPVNERRYRSGAENWYYPDGGVVYFNARGRVTDWREPALADYRTTRTHRTYSRNYSSSYWY